MADLSDDDLTTIIATVTGDQSDLSGDARFEAMRAAIAADRALNAPGDERAAWWALVMGAAASIEDTSNCLRDPDAKRQAEGAAKHFRDAANALWIAHPPQAAAPSVGAEGLPPLPDIPHHPTATGADSMTPEQSAAVQKIREALAAGPTDGPWFTPTDVVGYAVATIGKARICSDTPPKGDPAADLAYIAACDPATIRTLLAALDAAQATHVGESAFKAWFAQYNPAGKGDKQRARDAYAAGMADPAAQAPREVPRLTDADIAACVAPLYADPVAAQMALPMELDAARLIESRVRELCGVKP